MHFTALLDLLDIIGTLAFATSGAVVAMRKRLDLVGFLIISCVTATGGGMLRDIILGHTPPAALMEPRDLTIAFAVGVFSFIFAGRFARQNERLFLYCDALGLGVFTAIGAAKAHLVPGHTLALVLTTGMLTGIGGSILRDTMTKEVPFVFRKEIYATASFLGALAFYPAFRLFGEIGASYLCFFITSGIRIFAIRYRLNMPRASLKR